MVMDVCNKFSYDYSPHEFILILLLILHILLLAGPFFFDFDLISICIAYPFQPSEVKLQDLKHQLYIIVLILFHLLV